MISPAPFILKGEGWYVTDYPSEARKKAKEAEKSSNGGDKTSDKKPSDKKTSDAGSGTTTAPSAPASASAPKSD